MDRIAETPQEKQEHELLTAARAVLKAWDSAEVFGDVHPTIDDQLRSAVAQYDTAGAE